MVCVICGRAIVPSDVIVLPMAEQISTSGYDCVFVDCPKNITIDCSICLLVLREPRLTSCCGQNFCRRCIEKVKLDGKACPLCNDADFIAVCNKSLGESLNNYEVYCGHRGEGCEWSGKLVELDTHLSRACLHADVGCSFNCGTLSKRCNISAHEASCHLRPSICCYCGDPGVYEDILNKHWPVCPKYPTLCPNRCGDTLERCHLAHHLDNICSLSPSDCEFSQAGCGVRPARGEVPSHLAADLIPHLSLVNKHLQQENSRLSEVLLHHVSDLQALRTAVDDLRAKVAHDRAVVTMISQLPTTSKELLLLPITVPPPRGDQCTTQIFYSHLGGYKMQAQLFVAATQGAPILYCSQLQISIMKGEFDDHLKWPFNGVVVVRVGPDQHHFITFQNTPVEHKSRVQHMEGVAMGPVLEVTTKRLADITIESVQLNV